MTAFLQREILPRTVTHKFGESPTAERRFVVSTDGETLQQDVLNMVGIYHLSPHPEWPFLMMLSVSVTETDPYHSEITYSYSMPEQQDTDPNPLARPDIWNFSAGGSNVPAADYFDGVGNATIKPLVNAAGDTFDGVTKTEAELTATISGNRANFDVGLAALITNCVNNAAYLGGAQYTWLCTGISGLQATEMVANAELRYWQVAVTLIYRQSTHLLKLADAGLNFLDAGTKKRCFVVDEAGFKINSANPMALDAAGAMQAPAVDVRVIQRRMHPEINFQQYFGVPPLAGA